MPSSTLDAGGPTDSPPLADTRGTDAPPGDDVGIAVDVGGLFDGGPRVDSGPPDMRMSFFVTSTGSGASGGDLGGLAGADARCQALATTAGVGDRTWHAYLSVSPIGGATPVDARDRIGPGPWFDFAGAMVAADVAALHTDGLDYTHMLTELGGTVPMDEHDILTGTEADGTHFESFPGNPTAPGPTCLNWTSGTAGDYAWVGHHNWNDPTTTTFPSWNSAHESECNEAGLRATSGAGRFYCFAID